MPSLSRRRETHVEAERFESEVRQSELQAPDFAAKRKFVCSGCGRIFEERSRNCPRCEKRTMNEAKPIPSQYVGEARRNALRRARARL